ncbi:hypothetical protein ACIBHX_01650 [Nonomuraea sp. NPDC050536]|uniref:hypothetical protein n=1 Tax=Nonomuraea sp. NPDC050536 TaxID=3364366 RepID=UPI0037CB3D9F
MSLPKCCEQSLVRGEHPSQHALVCEHRPPTPAVEPVTDALFEIHPPTSQESGPQL